MIKAIIFDFDGLIIDTETAWYEAFREALKFYEADLPLEEFAKCIGTDDTVLYEYFKKQLGERCNAEEIKSRAYDIHKEKMAAVQAREGVKEYLRRLKFPVIKLLLLPVPLVNGSPIF